MSDVYCGASAIVPKNKKRGTMKECYDMNQVRYWGIKKIDTKKIDKSSKKKKKENTKDRKLRSKLLEKVASIDGKAKKLKKKIQFTKNPTKTMLKEFQKESDKLKLQRKEVVNDLKAIDKKLQKSK